MKDWSWENKAEKYLNKNNINTIRPSKLGNAINCGYRKAAHILISLGWIRHHFIDYVKVQSGAIYKRPKS